MKKEFVWYWQALNSTLFQTEKSKRGFEQKLFQLQMITQIKQNLEEHLFQNKIQQGLEQKLFEHFFFKKSVTNKLLEPRCLAVKNEKNCNVWLKVLDITNQSTVVLKKCKYNYIFFSGTDRIFDKGPGTDTKFWQYIHPCCSFLSYDEIWKRKK